MFKLGFMGAGGVPPRRQLFLGAHCDGIEVGCGGTVLKLANELRDLEVHWVVLSSNDVRESEARKAAATFLESFNNVYVRVESFCKGYFFTSPVPVRNS